jgi:hypothetical protein
MGIRDREESRMLRSAASGTNATAYLDHALCGEDAEAEPAAVGNPARRAG